MGNFGSRAIGHHSPLGHAHQIHARRINRIFGDGRINQGADEPDVISLGIAGNLSVTIVSGPGLCTLIAIQCYDHYLLTLGDFQPNMNASKLHLVTGTSRDIATVS